MVILSFNLETDDGNRRAFRHDYRRGCGVAWAEAMNPWLKNHGYPTMYEIVPGFVACALAIVVVSLFGKPAAGVVERFEQANRDYHANKHGKVA